MDPFIHVLKYCGCRKLIKTASDRLSDSLSNTESLLLYIHVLSGWGFDEARAEYTTEYIRMSSTYSTVFVNVPMAQCR